MFRNVQAAIARGLSVAFFSGNAVCGRIVLGPDAAGQPDRAFERVGVFGPPGGTHEFDSMTSIAHERPYANELIGAHSTGPVTGGADWICRRPDHWLFAGTGMKEGDGIPGLVGWEWHGDPAPIPGLEVVAGAPTQRAGQTQRRTVHRHGLPGPQGQHRLQRRHHLVGRRPERTAGLPPARRFTRNPRARIRAFRRSRGTSWNA